MICPTFDGKSWTHHGLMLATSWSHTKFISTLSYPEIAPMFDFGKINVNILVVSEGT